ncbi:Sad1/UNC domain-containing protein [Pleurostoma richardsiae]|uniref:Sad1/UNC domain-containing protein n=1 Tax=Pleurostoma richardsiae TaxID=41990 RepID=A0AA38VIN6_9PEZI|nr:Sad1/UNC domain-containing protein [Pleurostoma richardsiae]
MRLSTGGPNKTLLVFAALLNLQRGLAASRDHSHGSGYGTHDLAGTPETCESRTINYITHTLPQQCLRTSWSTANSTIQTETANTAATHISAAGSAPTAEATQNITHSGTSSTEQKAPGGVKGDDAPKAGETKEAEEDDGQDLATGSFMSFEEWKEMMLRKSGQDPADIRGRKQNEGRGGEVYPGSSNADLDSLGDDGEIALDFDVLSDKISEMAASSNPNPTADARRDRKGDGDEPVLYDDGMAQYPRPKDAGKTCKERFSFSSFDGGATVLKTSPGAKNAKAILVENKDSYMLFTCAQENKYVIVELSEDILVDTVVLANFEFFSSMIRRFRVSVSDRYPVKMDRWKELGTFEARNTRDIQAFLVDNPKIWAKYIRIEFLTHYGNEYYCPVSLLRVHGTRMLDTWKDAESGRDESDAEETISAPEPEPEVIPDQPLAETPEPTNTTDKTNNSNAESTQEMGLSPWHPTFYVEPALETCGLGTPTTTETIEVSPAAEDPSVVQSPPVESVSSTKSSSPQEPTSEPVQNTSTPSTAQGDAPAPSPSSSPAAVNASIPIPTADTMGSNSTQGNSTQPRVPRSDVSTSSTSVSKPSSKAPSPSPSSPSSTVIPIKPTTVAHPSSKNKTSTATISSAAPSPTVQESFFKTVSKRLQLLESNTTLSLQYIEEQSRFLQDALGKMERRQIARVDAFLGGLNRTVLAELRGARAQYDQIWQSTVIALETQREASQREILALSSRLSLLADEVVFQRRMAILQSVLLLACLLLVIFSRGSPVDLAFTQGFSSALAAGAGGRGSRTHRGPLSPPLPSASIDPYASGDSPSPPRAGGRGDGRPGQFSRSLSYTEKTLPLTPTSDYDRGGTPTIQVIDAQESSENTTCGPLREPKVDSPPPDVEGNESQDAGIDTPQTGTDDSGEEQSSNPPLTRSSLSEFDKSRKPLPALPEDPS